MATDDRERLDAIANAIMAPHVAQQQHASERLRGKRSGRLRWTRIVAACIWLGSLGQAVVELIPEGRMTPFRWVFLAVLTLFVFAAFRRKE